MSETLFALRRLIQGDDFLKQHTSTPLELAAELQGKKVAIVGNARSLSQQSYGTDIDDCDLVIRMHAAPLPDAHSHGSKTQWLALGMPVAQNIIETRNPDRLLWMAKKRKRVRKRFANHPGFYLHPTQEWDKMASILNAPPTTGVMLIDLVSKSNAASIQLFGFDFFTSLSLSGRRTADQVPHDFAAEKSFVETLVAQDSRVVLNT